MDALTNGLAVAIAGALFSFVAWIAPRTTKKGRLLLEIRRLGEARANLAPTSELARFDSYVDQRIRELNEWLDPVNETSRSIQNAVSWGLASLGSFLIVLVPPLVSDAGLRSAAVVGIVTGTILLGAVGMLAAERWARNLATRRQDEKTVRESRNRTAAALGLNVPEE